MLTYLTNMDYDLITELQNKIKQLEITIKTLRRNGEALAQAEKDYKILLRQECLKLRDGGMAVGMIEKICYGIPSVADARFKRDVADATYKANQEAINSIKLQLRLLDAQIGREWGVAGKGDL